MQHFDIGGCAVSRVDICRQQIVSQPELVRAKVQQCVPCPATRFPFGKGDLLEPAAHSVNGRDAGLLKLGGGVQEKALHIRHIEIDGEP